MSDPIHADLVEPEEVDWLWGERIPRSMISVVAGRPDQGKGLFACMVAADLSRRGFRVLYSAIEDSYGLMTRPRLEAAGAILNNILLWRFQLPDRMSELDQVVRKKKIDLVILDPFAAHLGPGISRTSDSIRKVLNPITEMLEDTGAGMLVIEHALKRIPKGSHPLNAIGGAGSGLPAAARMAYILGVDPDNDDQRVLAAVKSNLRERPLALLFSVDVRENETLSIDVPCLVYEEELEFFEPMRLFENKDKTGGPMGRPPDKRAAAAEWLTNYLLMAGNAVKAGKVMEDAIASGMTNKTLRRASEDMGVVKEPPGGGRNCTWDLPQELKDLMGVETVPEMPQIQDGDVDDLEWEQGLAELLGDKLEPGE